MHESELTLLLEGTGDAAFAVDLRGQIRTWNRSAAKMFGCEASAALERPCPAVVNGHNASGAQICKQDCFTLECARRSSNGTGQWSEEFVNFDMEARPRGRRFWANVSILLASDTRTGRRLVVHFVRDISNRKRNEDFAADVLKLGRRLRSSKRAGGLASMPSTTLQERRILELIRDGNGTDEIARKLGISAATLRNHIHHLNRKLGTRSRVEAVMQALRCGLI